MYSLPDYFGQTFIEDVQEQLPTSLLSFWGMRNFYHIYQNESSFDDFVAGTITETFHGVEQSKLPDFVSKLKAAQRRRRLDWCKLYQSYMKYDITDIQHPLSSEYLSISKMAPTEYVKKYKDQSIDLVIQNKIYEMNQKIDEWKKNRNALHTEFPAFSILSKKQQEHALTYDIVACTCDYLSSIKFNMSSTDKDKDNVKSLPSPIISKPIFSLSTTKIALEEIDGIIQKVINEKNGTFSVIPIGTSELVTLNKYDYEIYQQLTKLAEHEGKMTDSGRLVIHLNYRDIASQMYSYTINNSDLERVKQSLNKLAARRFIHKQGTRVTEYVLIDSISYDIESNNMATIVLGSVVSDAITQKDLISISKKDEEKISSKYGKSFMHPLQKLRFMVYRANPETLSVKATMDFFEDSVYFTTKSFKKKASIIMDALDDFVSHEVLIKEYSFSNDTFNIIFLPFSGDDMHYYTEWLKVNRNSIENLTFS